MSHCPHYKIEYLGPLVHDGDKHHVHEKLHRYDLYNCHQCNSTIAIDRYELSKLEKEVINTEVK